MTEDNVPSCAVCGKPKDKHPFRHMFVEPGESPRLTEKEPEQSTPPAGDQSSQGRVRMTPAGDPVLRMALIRAGIIKVEDLDAIETELRVTGVAGYEPPTNLG